MLLYKIMENSLDLSILIYGLYCVEGIFELVFCYTFSNTQYTPYTKCFYIKLWKIVWT